VWEVTVDHLLVPACAGVPALDLGEAADALVARFGAPPVADRERFSADGVVLEDPAEVIRLDRGGATTSMGRGRLTLTASGLSLAVDGRAGWSLPAEALLAVRMDVGNVLLARTSEATFRLAPDDGSTRKWEHFLRGWLPPAER